MLQKFKAKLRKKENVFISGKNSDGSDLIFWKDTVLGKILGWFGLNVQIQGLTGRQTPILQVSNIVVSSGLAGAAARIYDDSVVKKFNLIAIGTGTTAPVIGNTSLEAEITTGGGERGTATISRSTSTVANDTTNWSKTWIFTAPFAVSECGIFNADNILLARVTFPVQNVVSGYSLTFNWSIDNA